MRGQSRSSTEDLDATRLAVLCRVSAVVVRSRSCKPAGHRLADPLRL